ncbi:MAG: hypothetical protein KDD50_05285 [Bdellovibrionales bacterium]|nr:hypothetical protein [Bdellovibrionales bacterium]
MWNVTLRLNNAFAHIAARPVGSLDSESKELFETWFLPKKPLLSYLKTFLETHNIDSIHKFVINTRIGESLLEKGLMNPCAFLTTAGFENWPLMNLPVQSRFFTLYPKRTSSPINQELIFGLDEATDVNGNITENISEQSIETLVAKLKLNNVEDVAIGFIHSNRNKDNEFNCGKLLQEKGFNIFLSYHADMIDSVNYSELSRWWSAIVNASLHSPVFEYLENIQTALAKNLKGDILQIQNSRLENQSYDSKNYLNTCLAHHALLSKQLRKLDLLNDQSVVVHFGIEEFVAYQDNKSPRWLTNLGAILYPHDETQLLKIQPTQVIEKNIWGSAGFKFISRASYSETFAKQIGFDPGPICLGRGMKPTFLDLLFLKNKLESVSKISDHLVPQRKRIVLENLLSASKDAQKTESFSDQQITDWLMEQAVHQIYLDLVKLSEYGKKKLILTGPLASALTPDLKKYIAFETYDLSSKSTCRYFQELIAEH